MSDPKDKHRTVGEILAAQKAGTSRVIVTFVPVAPVVMSSGWNGKIIVVDDKFKVVETIPPAKIEPATKGENQEPPKELKLRPSGSYVFQLSSVSDFYGERALRIGHGCLKDYLSEVGFGMSEIYCILELLAGFDDAKPSDDGCPFLGKILSE